MLCACLHETDSSYKRDIVATSVPAKKKKDAYQDQLDSLNREVAALRDQLYRSQRLAAVGTMTAMVAHEFNNILTPIISYAQLARTNPALADKAIARAADGGRRATDICNAILGLVRQQATAASTAINLSEVVQETLRAMAREPRKDGIELELSVPPELTVTARKVELQQVLLNLLMNARHAVLQKPQPRRIEIAAEKGSSCLLLHIKDTGVGIAQDNLDKIFNPFFTTKTSESDDSQGHGLGLTICRQIIENLGGSISVESVVGQGTTFILRLPTL